MRGYKSEKVGSLLMLIMVSGALCGSPLLASEWDSRTLHGDPQDIVDYFLRLPRCWYDEIQDTLNIFEVRKGYLIPNGSREVTIDIGNAYLQIRDNLNELEQRLTITYFVKNDGSRIIGFSEYYMGGDCDFYDMNFYTYGQQKWDNVTDEVLPPLHFADFWEVDTSLFIEQYLDIDKNIHYHYEFPRYGTTVEASVEPLEALICFELYESVDFEGEDEFNMVFDEYYGTVRNRPVDVIELQWNREEGVFVIKE